MDEVKTRSEKYGYHNNDHKKKRRIARWLKWLIFIVILVSSILLYGHFIGTKGLRVKEYTIKDNHLTDNFYGFKVAHLSDIHYGRNINKDDLEEIINRVNLLKPDIVVITGDLFDQDITLDDDQINELITELKRIDARIKKYAITGNHDIKLEKWQEVINDSGFINLNDNYDLIYNNDLKPIIISGISSSDKQEDIDHKLDQTNTYLNSLTNKDIKPIYSILLMHEPDFIDDIDTNKFNLILAGHSHNGQINIPKIKTWWLPKYAEKYYDDYYEINGSKLYISSGLGTSKLDIRLFNKPSFNFYRLVNK